MSVRLNLSTGDVNSSAHKRQARIFEPIAPVDTNRAPKPASGSALMTFLSSITRASEFQHSKASTDLWDDESALAVPPPQPQPVAASRSPAITFTSRTTPVNTIPHHL
jgi:hypothetical protein